MTLLELKTQLAWEGKLEGDVESIAQLDGIIADAMIFIGQSHPELMLTSAEDYDLDSENPTPYVDALGVDRVELSGNENLTEPVTIPEEGNVVGLAPVEGWPKCYTIDGNAYTSNADPKGLRVTLVGGGSLDVGVDLFTVYWKRIPLLTDDTHIVPSSWIGILKKECLGRIAASRAKGELENAKLYMGAAQTNLQAEVGTDGKSTSATN